MGISKNNCKVKKDPTVTAVSRYMTARNDILLLVLMTVVNIALQVSGSFTYFLFSASVPYLLLDTARLLCGMYPAEYYPSNVTSADFFGKGLFAVMLVIALLIVAVYLFFFFRTKRVSVGFMSATLILFALDTVVLFLFCGISADLLIDYAFHVYIIVAQVLGIRAASYLKQEEAAGRFGGVIPSFRERNSLYVKPTADVPEAAATEAEAEPEEQPLSEGADKDETQN